MIKKNVFRNLKLKESLAEVKRRRKKKKAALQKINNYRSANVCLIKKKKMSLGTRAALAFLLLWYKMKTRCHTKFE